MKLFYLLLLFSSFPLLPLWGQVSNDECTSAIALPEEQNYCSGPGAFANTGATGSLEPNDYPVCLDERDQIADVWYSFVALRNSVNIIVSGDVAGNPRGTLRAPQFALLEGDCGTFTSIGCRSPFENPTTGEIQNGGNLIFEGLNPGQTYYILIGGRTGNTGTFELCVNQFDAVPSPSSDCETGVILCDKSSFAVDFLSGSGNVNDDIQSGNIDCGSPPTEFNSAWYRWTCDQPGSLTFTITPLGAAFNEDIDFVVFELTNGLQNCGSKTVLRQMFSGETNGNGVANLPCLGPTGLSDSDQDVSENCGCSLGDNNFASAIEMEAGRSYALVVMNFSGSGDGFSIEWGGTGTFVGPEIDFTFSSSEVCVGEAVTFEDRSTSLDQIISREWDFGESATPRTASGPGPHEVVFGAPGSPGVQLIIETERECREILNQREVNVICCTGQFVGSGVATDVLCPNDITGAIDLTAVSNFSPSTLTYNWSNGEMSEDLANLGTGDYTVTLSDASGCEETLSFTVDGPAAFTFDTLITMPDCAGGTNGELVFTILSGGQGPYEYSFNAASFTPTNRLTNLSVSTVNVRARDANNCLVEQDIEVDELELGLVQGEPLFTEPVCAGEASGSIDLQLANGTPAYRYDFGLGDGFQSSSVRNGLAADTYTVTAEDAEGCRGIFAIEITEPPAILLGAQPTDISCFGAADGMIEVSAEGGRPDYSFSWSDGGSAGDSRADLRAGSYTVSVSDQNGCVRSASVIINEPNEIFPVLEATNDLRCNGEPTGSFLLSATGGTPEYTYSADGENFQVNPLLSDLLAGDYLLYAMDANGCLDSLRASLTEPVDFIVDPGNDVQIDLGFDTILQAVSNYNPVSYAWGPDSLLCLDPACTRVRAQPVATTLFTVVGTNADGCRDTATVEVTVLQNLPLYIPTAFTPNSDGNNDGFTIFAGPAVDRIQTLRIFDRWGGLVFEAQDLPPNNPSLGWDGSLDGRPLNPGVFTYSAAVRFLNGKVDEVAGEVTLLR